MKNITGFDIQVIPLDNEGYLVQFSAERSPATTPPVDDGPMNLFAMMRQQTPQRKILRVYCPDAAHCGMIISEFIAEETVRQV